MDTDQIEMIMTENLSDFSLLPIHQFPSTQSSINTNTTNSTSTSTPTPTPLPQIIHNPHLNSPTFITPQFPISFTHPPTSGEFEFELIHGNVFPRKRNPDEYFNGNGNVFTQKRNSREFHGNGNVFPHLSRKKDSMAEMREMIFRVSAMQPIHIDPESVKPPKRRNVRISKDPQSVAARHRRERISERIRILQRIVPGGTKLDTASMLDEAIHYVKFLKSQVRLLEGAAAVNRPAGTGFPVGMSSGNCFPMGRAISYPTSVQSVQQYLDV